MSAAEAGPAPYVFISSSGPDREFVRRLAAALADLELIVRWDEELRPDATWMSRLDSLRARAAAVLVVWSRASMQSRFVLDEARAARRDGTIVPITLDGFDSLPSSFRDLATLDLSGWAGDEDDPRFRQLVAQLERRVHAAGGGPPTGKAADEPSEPPARVAARLRGETVDLLGWAAAVQQARGAAAAEDVDVILGGLAAARAGVAAPSAHSLYQAVVGDERLDGALRAMGAARPILQAIEPQATVPSALDRAVAAAQATGTFPAVWSRHLLAGALSGHPLPPAAVSALGTDDAGLRRILRGYVADRWPDEPADAWDAILADPEIELTSAFARDLVPVWRRPRPGETAPRLTDHLGVDVYVGMLATLIARRSTAMPLSIGLFGEWGSGKSYFMELLHQQVETLSGTATDDGAYLADIVQVRFNAWHYADTNLWASLAAEFFDQLAREDTDPVEERRREIAAQLTHAQREQETLEESATAARERAVALRTALAAATAKRDRARRTFNTRLVQAVLADPEIKNDVNGLAERLGVGASERERVLQLAADVQGIGDDLGATRRVAATRSRRWPFVLLVLATLLLAAAAVVPEAWVSWLRGGAVATVATFVGSVGVAAGRARALARDLRGLADRAKAVESRVRDGDGELVGLAADVRAADAQEAAARAEVDQAVSRVAELRRQLELLRPGRRLYDFLAERAASTEYRSRLGVISLVRRDFEQLVALMDDWHRHPDPDRAYRPIDRIVLYIDDLDRCEPDQVVTVLQAVHLLLAMDLFVVVVGVDPRWLLRSLRRRYRRVLGAAAVAEGDREIGFSESTPQNYLEKIFQVPFVLPGMDAAGFGGLVEHLARRPAAPAVASTTGQAPAPSPTTPSAAPTHAQTAEARSEVATVLRGRRPATVTPITDAELALLKRLSGLVRTPRGATRLVNIYGLLRSTRDLTPHEGRFLDAPNQPGDHQAVAQLLGILTAAPQLLGTLLWGRGEAARGLCHADPAGGWAAFLDGLNPRHEDGRWRNAVADALSGGEVRAWRELVDDLRTVRPAVTLDELARYQLWAPKIARFSFLLSPFAAPDPAPFAPAPR